MKIDTPFKLFANCLPVKGAERSAICDVQRRSVRLIPNILAEILIEHDGKAVGEIIKTYGETHRVVITEYFEVLENEEYIFFTDTPVFFPKLDLTWKEPNLVLNSIIDINEASRDIDWRRIALELDALGCKYLQIRSFSDLDMDSLGKIINSFQGKRTESIELLIQYHQRFSDDATVEFCRQNPRVTSMYLSASPFSKIIDHPLSSSGKIIYLRGIYDSSTHCGITTPDYFSINLSSFTESQHHNSCLNRKISIDTEGNIKNCPSMKESYGNVRDTTLREALEKPGFKKYWNITKDQIAVCKDCEFRYICTDCRAYLEDPEDIHSKPLKCGYNPYTCEWEEWSTNPLKQQAIEYYGMQELVKKESSH